ncbi:MAG: FAD-dependent oxidoreductase [Lachnospiraceae bacterium]|nr:FAD-dependent oxidoreductase [Lachnospiraceae bacterium]
MIRLNQLKILPGQEDKLSSLVAKALSVREDEMIQLNIVKKSLDARKKPELFWIYTLDVELKSSANFKRVFKNKNVSSAPELKEYQIPKCGKTPLEYPPVVVGMGPAGLFSAYLLAKRGFKPIVIERGNDVDSRIRDVEDFWQGKSLKPDSNVQFGEGGAGTFSDGKLNTGVKDKDGRNRAVLKIFCAHGAKEDILYDGKPHIGTDVLATVVKSMREEIIALGGKVLFGHQFVGYEVKDSVECMNDIAKSALIESSNEFSDIKMLKAVKVKNLADGSVADINTNVVILAIGHSSRDTYEMLYEKELPMEAKPFAVGVRVEHSQDYINRTQYGAEYKERYADSLPASPYKLTARAEDGRGVYSFCMCPGGFVVNASSEEGRLAVNGMSYSGRNAEHANSAIVVAIDEKDYGTEHVLAGMHFQRELEEKAYKLCDGKIPVQFYEDFKANVQVKLSGDKKAKDTQDLQDHMSNDTEEKTGDFMHSIKGLYAFADVTEIFPTAISKAIVDGMETFDHTIPGFAKENPLLCGVESRTSAPVRILRDEFYQAKVRGIYPCGEGAGYAGGITSAAMDGMKVAESIIVEYRPQI